CGWGGRGGGGG
ncbi:hypothetical protein CFC21_039054, partial [Triticum aestivum]